MPHEPPWRKMLTEHLKGRLLHLLKLLAKNKKACALLKLTPHKNTPVPSKGYRIMSPQAIRKLHFDNNEDSMKNTTETKVYRNTARGRRNAPIQKIDSANQDSSSTENIWHCSSLFAETNAGNEDIPHQSHKVVNLQEPLMQNKEICFSTGMFDSKMEFDTPCIEVHENNPPQQSEDTLIPTTVHDDKYEAISDDDEPLHIDLSARSEQELSPVITRPADIAHSLNDSNDINRIISPSLLDIKKRVNYDEYLSLKDFNHDMTEVIERTLNGDLKSIYRDLFVETFPWFDCENNCLQPNLEVEGEHDESISVKDQDIVAHDLNETKQANIERHLDQIVPKLESDGDKLEELLEINPLVDSRTCILCKTVGDGLPDMEGRLLYCGQNDWIHANCALWSAEVFEEIDGSLQNVHSAISRGKMIKCAVCEIKGASVGCCAKNCSETYHYSCARKETCAFMDDKRVFCPTHGKDIPKKNLQKDADFELTRPVYVELDKKKKRYSEINKVQFLLGSLTVQSLGKIVPSVSDYEDFLMPVDFMCSRLFWSCKKPSKVVRYTIRTKLILSEPLPGFDVGVNITVNHTMNVHVVDRVMAEIGAWHQSLENGSVSNALIKKDKSPVKLGYGLTLEDIAVKHVVDYLLDNVCKQEQQDEEEPQNTADLLPPELKDAIFEDLNHDLLDGISMQDIFPKLMSYEDLASMDLKNEFYGAITQSDDKSIDKADRSTTDFIDELLSARLESGCKELKRSKSEILLQNQGLKTLTTGRGQQRSSSLTWNNKFDTNLLSSTIKRCKMGRTSTVTGKLSPVQKTTNIDMSNDTAKESQDGNDKKKEESTSNIVEEAPHTSGLSYQTTSPKEKEPDANNDKDEKTEGYYTDVIDFYTKIQCSPISQLDGSCDWSESESTSSSRPSSPQEVSNFTNIPQLDGADDNLSDNVQRHQQNNYIYRASGSESTYTVTIAGNSISGQPELVMRPLEDIQNSSPLDQPVRCDRCQCTYRNKESYDRHIPSCDMMSTSESESENPKSPESRTLTTLQNAFQSAFAQPMIIHAGVVSGSDSTVKSEGISARRTSINTRQITINGTIVETSSPSPSNEMTMTITEQMKSGTLIFDQCKGTNVQVSASQQVLSSPQIVVTPQMLLPPKNTNAAGQKFLAPQIITQNGGLLPYNFCVKSGQGNTSIQHIQSGTDMTQILSGTGGIQVLSSNSNQVLTIPSNQQLLQGKNSVVSFPNMASATSIAVPVNSLQGIPNTSIIQNIQPMMRPQIQNNSTIVVPAMTAQRLASPNMQAKQQFILSSAPQKSPKKHSQHVQSKQMFQATNRGRGRPIPKQPAMKRQTKMEKTFTINQSPLAGNTVIQLQTNNQTGQPSIIVQPVGNQNLMSAYVEALSQQQNQNMQYIATIAPQNDFKTGPTQFISQGGLMPQTFQIQQTENGGLVAVPSGSFPVLLPQGNVGLLPQTLQQGATILPQGTLQTQGIISQGPSGPTIIPQTIHTQNGTIIPQGTIQGLNPGTITSQTATLMPNNTLQTAGGTMVPQSGISNTQTTIIPNTLQSQGGALISSTPGATLLPQGTILPQFCNDQVILGSTPTIEMVTDSSGCMYLTTTQPVYYGLETIVQNTVMSSQQFVSTAMQGVLAQNSSFSATTTQVFQASKIEPIVEVPTGYVVVNNVGDAVTAQASAANVVTGSTLQNSTQSMKSLKTVPNLTLQPLPDKINSNRQTSKVIQMSPSPIAVCSQSGSLNIIGARPNINPITSQIHTMNLSNTIQNVQRGNMQKPINVSVSPNVTLVSSTGQPLMALSQSTPNSVTSFTMPAIPSSQPVVTSAVTNSSMNKSSTPKIENAHVIEISGNIHDNTGNMGPPTISVSQNLKSPTPWRQINASTTNVNMEQCKSIDMQGSQVKGSGSNMGNNTMNLQNNTNNMKTSHANESDKINQSCLMSISSNANVTNPGTSIHLHQFESSLNDSHHSSHPAPNNVIQITAGNIYTPSPSINTFDAETTLKLNKINALSKAEGGHLNFSQEIMSSHSQHLAQNDKTFQNLPNNDNKHNAENINRNIHTLSSCQMVGNNNSSGNIPQNMLRLQNSPSSLPGHGHQSQIMSIANNNNNMQLLNNGINNRISGDCSMQQTNPHHDINTNQINQNISQNNLQLGHDSNQIHIMNGQIQHSRSGDNSHIQQGMMTQSPPNRMYHENVMSNRNSTDNNSIMNQPMMHNMNNHNINRQQMDMSHMHIQQPMNNVNNMQSNRMLIDNMQTHQVNNMNHQMHQNRPIDNMHNMQQLHHNNRQQIDNNVHINSQMGLPQNRQMDNHHHHQHPMSNVMQIHNNRPHIENNLLNMHSHMPNQMHNRSLDANMHMHHMPSNTPTPCMNNQLDNTSPMNQNMNSIHGRHDGNTMQIQNMNVLNQIQNNRSMDHTNMMQHQMANMNMHNNLNPNMQISNSSQQAMNNPMLHAPNIPDIKNEIQNSCSGSCSNNNAQFSNNQAFDMCSAPNLNTNNNMNAGSLMHNISVNNTNLSNNMMINNVNNSQMFGSNISSHELLMSCSNNSDHNISGMLPSSSNHIILNNSQTHSNNNQNPLLNNQQLNLTNANPINSPQNQIANLDTQINRPSMGVNEQIEFPQEPIRGKNMLGQQQPAQNITAMQSLTTNDCAKVNILSNDKQSHGLAVNNQMGYMQVNTQSNRVINLPERNRISNDNNMNQHNIPQHIRVVTNNNNTNIGTMNEGSGPMNFQQKTEANSTMINVPFQAIPNSAPMNINVNSSNNTVNITVQNNLVDPKIASKAAADINFPLPTTTNLVQNQANTSNMICIPVQNSTINLQTQNSASISLPKAPSTQQSGIPTNVVNPISMRPMNRVLPLHRDGQGKSSCKTTTAPRAAPVPRQRPVSHDMPDLNVKEETVDSDLEKAIEESKRMMELERAKQQKEEEDAARAMEISLPNNNGINISDSLNTRLISANVDTTPKLDSLPNLDADLEIEPPKILLEKNINKIPSQSKLPSAATKSMKRPLNSDKRSESEATAAKKSTKTSKGQENTKNAASLKQNPDPPKDDGPKLIYEVTSEDGFNYTSTSLTDLWAKVVEVVQNARKHSGLEPNQYNLQSTYAGAHLLGLNNNALRYLVEQLPGVSVLIFCFNLLIS